MEVAAIVKKNMKRQRRKIEIKKIEDPIQLRVSFSKRRKGLLSKAAKLKDLCPGVEIAIVVQYPSGKITASGEPSEVCPIIDRYLAAATGTSSLAGGTSPHPDRVIVKTTENVKEEEEEEEEEMCKGLTKTYQTQSPNSKCRTADEGIPWEVQDLNRFEEYTAAGLMETGSSSMLLHQSHNRAAICSLGGGGGTSLDRVVENTTENVKEEEEGRNYKSLMSIHQIQSPDSKCCVAAKGLSWEGEYIWRRD